MHNAAWPLLGALTATSSPIVVNYYLAGDAGILIVVGLAVVGIWLAYRFRGSPDIPQDAAPLEIGGGEEPTSAEAPAHG
jgi:hypothetical protein